MLDTFIVMAVMSILSPARSVAPEASVAPSLQVKDERSIRVEELVEFTNIVCQIIVQKRIDDLEPPRVSRRLHFLRGWESSWEDQADIHQKSVSVQSGWCSSTRESTARSGAAMASVQRQSKFLLALPHLKMLPESGRVLQSS